MGSKFGYWKSFQTRKARAAKLGDSSGSALVGGRSCMSCHCLCSVPTALTSHHGSVYELKKLPVQQVYFTKKTKRIPETTNCESACRSRICLPRGSLGALGTGEGGNEGYRLSKIACTVCQDLGEWDTLICPFEPLYYTTWRLQRSSCFVITCFLIFGSNCNILPTKEHRRNIGVSRYIPNHPATC